MKKLWHLYALFDRLVEPKRSGIEISLIVVLMFLLWLPNSYLTNLFAGFLIFSLGLTRMYWVLVGRSAYQKQKS